MSGASKDSTHITPPWQSFGLALPVCVYITRMLCSSFVVEFTASHCHASSFVDESTASFLRFVRLLSPVNSPSPQWGAADADIEAPSVENTEL